MSKATTDAEKLAGRGSVASGATCVSHEQKPGTPMRTWPCRNPGAHREVRVGAPARSGGRPGAGRSDSAADAATQRRSAVARSMAAEG